MLVLGIDLAPLGTVTTGAIALIAALANGARLARWGGWQARRVPLLWVLHVAYGFLVLALTLKGIGQLTGAAIGAKWLHALTIGCFATMIAGVMVRVSLGHTGRALAAPRIAVLGFVLLPLAALIRTLAPALAPITMPCRLPLPDRCGWARSSRSSPPLCRSCWHRAPTACPVEGNSRFA